jgi:hypothetical protein
MVEASYGPRWLVAAGPQVQVDPAAPGLELVDLALAVDLPFLGVAWLSWTVGWRRGLSAFTTCSLWVRCTRRTERDRFA